MTQPSNEDTQQLLRRARDGERQAVEALLMRHRARLKKMVAVRLDRRLARRVDPSDVIQETLATAHQRMDMYLKRPTIGFYPWLRGIAWERLVDLQRRHVNSQRRSINREATCEAFFSDESSLQLANSLVAARSGPSGPMIRAELCLRVRRALEKLTPAAREVLALRFAEQLTAREAAEAIGISESAFKGRQVRALDQMRSLLDTSSEETH